ncbi:GTPase required for pre-60S ribosomal subunit nuclear export and maturation [Didymosphaeria variabile]|uniref:GTPase required for pre-60S ribosomal subunit nuclear export and maturation n=1 Tax=Didymosphaeria variabile TaxID=1932322 RepID=A0A9W8XTE5_9PLEO|nr:GTPase required for pre-60S ribosomal subunit nuclear export and maturation [Didymosphaeria variabile]KAJ4358782.1 GTPase required for pre-60S ribosomal subunit nuclear export and maturation [Didymosphaeria variabile]
MVAAWVRHLSKEFPTLAFHASINNSFGKGSLISLLRQFSQLHADRKQISVGLIGYPNVGKSSIVNTLRNKPVCTVAPIAGETKVWQYITLMKRIYLIDCPGIVPPNQQDTDEELLLRGSVRVENVAWPAQYVEAVLRRVQPKHLQRTYDVTGYTDSTSFLELLCRKMGRLLKGGEADLDAVARIVLNDWIRGKIPWFTPPPLLEGEGGGPVKGIDGREGKLGEMHKKRKRGAESEATESVAATTDVVDEKGDDDEFDGFSDDGAADVAAEDGDDAQTLVAEGDASDEDVEEEVAAISAALSKAKKRQRKQ